MIVPIYNVEVYLRRCLDSIINQTYKNLQIILIDDGSIDKSKEICDKYAQIDSRITVIHKENGGPASARKAGIALAKGEYIGFVDGDDYIDSDFYQRLLKDMTENDVDFVNTGYMIENGRTSRKAAQYSSGVYDLTDMHAEFIKAYMLMPDSGFHIGFGVWCKLFKSDLVKKSDIAVPENLRRGEDMLLVCSCVMNSRKLYLDTNAGYHYVMREDSIVHSCQVENMIDFAVLYKEFIKLFNIYGIFETIRKELAVYFKNEYLDILSQVSKKVLIPRYEFAGITDIKGKKIILYGAGKVGQNYYSQMCRYKEITIVAWADRDCKKYDFDYREVIDSSTILDYGFDLLVVALLDKEIAMAVKMELADAGVPKDKIIWKEPSRIWDTEI